MSTKESSRMDCTTGKGSITNQKKTSRMKETSSSVCVLGKAHSRHRSRLIQEILRTASTTARESLTSMAADGTKGAGIKTKCMGMVNSIGGMVVITKDSICMTRKVAKESSNSKMVTSITGFGRMGCNMVKVYSQKRVKLQKQESGKKTS